MCFLVGQGVDAGPSDIGHELHAKMEEAAQKALAIIEHAGKYLDESAKEQSKMSVEPYNAKDFKKSEWEREKRQIPVPQTDSKAAKGTDSTKINRPGHNIRMYRTNFRQPTAHVQQNIFGKTLIEVRSPHLYASFGTFYAKIGLILEAQ